MTATLTAGIIGGPVSGLLLSLHGVAGLAGWQWLFLLEGVPAVLLGLLVLVFLTERPEDATWLPERGRTALIARLREEAAGKTASNRTASAALRSGRVWLLSIVYFTVPVGLYALGFWLPQIIQGSYKGNEFRIGLLSAIPYLAGAIAMVLAGRHSDRTGERRWHVAIGAAVSGAGFIATALISGLGGSLTFLTIAMAGLAAMFGPFWTLATSVVDGMGAAAGIALINSVGNIGGFVGPYLLGYIKDLTQSFAIGFALIGAIIALGGALVLAIPEARRHPAR